MITFDNVSFAYHSLQGETRAVSRLCFRVEPKSFVSMVGPSGCGKSTILSLTAGVLSPQEGEIRYDSDKKPIIGYMLQKDHLFYWRTIWQNCLLGPELQKTLDDNTKTRLTELLKEYGLWEFKDKKPQELSGGMRQRAALIRTLIMNPELLLLDEPFSALDFQTRLRVSDEITHIIREQEKTAILITHDLQEAISLGDRVLVLSSRPAHLIRDVTVHLTKSGDDLLSARNAPEFNGYFNMLWEDLKEETDNEKNSQVAGQDV
ncbi:MAG: ABC transporter ATP-binding protein [Lachnospiraceae bacterium]|nr:ABC transporter ATP-binding protein [Lachnospiraceae bacterium]